VTDLIARLTEAAAAGIRNERLALEHAPERLRGVTLELRIDGKGAVVEGVCYIERRVKGQRSCS